MQIVERLSYAHASAGWCTIVNNMEGMTMAIYIEDAGIAEVFRNGPDITIAGNGVPRGFARPVDGGYMISGHWAYGSGITHAEWIHTGCFVTDPSGKDMVIQPNGQPKVVITHHPRSTIKLLGNWDVLGLRATGSFDYTLAEGDELFVPTYRTYDFDIAAPRRGGLQGVLGLAGFSAWAHSSWAIGVGRRMLDELIKVIVQRDAFGKSSDSASFKFQFAQAEAKFRAAHALIYSRSAIAPLRRLSSWTRLERTWANSRWCRRRGIWCSRKRLRPAPSSPIFSPAETAATARTRT